jgi:ABC-type glycerol-3-phosphate transport system substrate-binding protein
VAAVAALGLGALSGCGAGSSSTSSNGKVTISFMEAMSSGTLKSSMTYLTDEFEKQNPNITVKLIEEPDYGTLQTKETAAVSAGNAPTIGQVYEDWAATFAKSNVILPLDASSGPQAQQLATFYTGVKQDLYLPGNKLYMWPFNKSVAIQIFNQQMMTQKHLTVPTTWAQFLTDAKAVSGNGVVGIAIDPGSASGPSDGTEMYEIMAHAYGTPVFAANGTPQFNSPAAIKALSDLVALKKAGALSIGTNYPGQTALGGGKGLFDVTTVASYYYDKQAAGNKFPLGTAPMPSGPAGAANQLAGTNIVMFASASKAQQAAAWKYMTFLDAPQQQAYWSSHSGYLPVTAQALPLMTGSNAAEPYTAAAAGQLNTALADPPYPWITKAEGDLAVGLQAAFGGKSSPSAALNSAQQQAMADMKSDQG